MNMKKSEGSKKGKIIGVSASLALVMAAAIGVTMAYYKSESDVAVNQFTVGNVTTELVEDFYQKEGSDTEFVKTPRVTNTGATPCLVRIRVSVTPESVVDREVTIAGETKKYLQIADHNNDPWLYNSEWSNDCWEYRDGWYYYKDVLQPGESTEALFSTVTVNYNEDNEWEDFDIILYHEAVQSVIPNGENPIVDASLIWKVYENTGKE